MPAATPLTKIEHTRSHGAEVIVSGNSLVEAYNIAKQLEQDSGLTFIHPYDDADVIAGQGTVAIEMLTDQPRLDAIVVPVGGGGLIAGVSLAVKALSPHTDVFGVQASGFPAMRNLLRGEDTQAQNKTLAEGIAVEHPGSIATEIVRNLVSDILLVDEAALERAVALYLNVEKTVAEGAGAAGLAGVLSQPDRFRDRKVGLILSGGNIDSRLLASIIMRELVRERRITTIRLPIEDRPGFLARVTSSLSEAGANVIDVQHHRTHLAFPAKVADIELTFEAQDCQHSDRVVEAVRQAGFVPTVVSF
jgi:threonine dehydratase